MLRNREIRWLLLGVSVVSILSAIIAAVSFSRSAAVLVLLTALLLSTVFLLLTSLRYREIEQLSRYLRQISSGDYKLDVRDNEEGELSILKNDIYKLTLMLSEQGASLQQDKLHLMDALSDISHQLKTPLTSMLVMVDLLSDAGLPTEKREEFTRNMSVQLERLEWLISSLLKLSKIDAGKVVFKSNRVHVDQLIHQALGPLLIPMDIKEQTITIEGDASVSFLGDLKWTVEAIINILKNGVEHTPEGGAIRITFEENPLFTEIVISDNGKGIPKDDLPYIFKRFYRGKQASEGSIGIGLAMAHSIVTKQNGAIVVQSEAGKGTRFQIKFYKGTI